MIGKRIRELRLERGMTQRELGAPRYTHAYVSTIESGRRNPSPKALAFFADKLGVTTEQLATGRSPDLLPRLEAELIEARIAVSDGRIEEAERAFARIAWEARRFELLRIQAKAEEGRALARERAGDPATALERYRRALELLEGEPAALRADAVAGVARCLAALGDGHYAIHRLESLLAELEHEGPPDPNALARIHASLVDAYLDAGLYRRAAESATELELLAPRLTDPARIAQMHMNTAHLYLVQGRIEEAERSLQRAEDAYRQLSLQTELGGTYLARGYVASREGRLGEAREHLERAVEVFEETGNEKDLVRALNELARVERLQGNPDRAIGLLERTIRIADDRDTGVVAWAHRELGIALAEHDPERAEKHLREAIALYERAEQAADLAVSYRALGDVLEARGDHEGAFHAYRTGILALERRL
ncbi:MAG: transcriptional regulator [Actinomycetota bacterium]|nr:MAG: transcriptional regulator [Actinomycetota bacterium]